MLTAIIALTILASVIGLVLGYASVRFRVEGDPIADKVDKLLPQTQCGQCGYPGCRPYAEAIAAETADINKCVPGGQDTIIAIAQLLGRNPLPPVASPQVPAKAVVDENNCIGCTLCIQACPVDAIVGAAKHLHQVICIQCTGCGLCVPPCPVECIHMVPIAETVATWRWPLPNEAV